MHNHVQPSGLPYSFINLKTRIAIPDADNRGMTSVAEAGSVSEGLSRLISRRS